MALAVAAVHLLLHLQVLHLQQPPVAEADREVVQHPVLSAADSKSSEDWRW